MGLAFYCIMTPYHLFTGTQFKRLRTAMAQATDRRVKIMNEMVAGARVVKLFAWEKSFAKVINAVRNSELRHICGVNYFNAVAFAMIFSGLVEERTGYKKCCDFFFDFQ